MSQNDNARVIEIRENAKEIAKIAERTQKYLTSENNIRITHAEAIPTIVYAFLRESVNFLNESKAPGETVTLNLMQILDLGISHRENGDAEKEGNYTPFAGPGQEFKVLVKDDAETEDEG